MLVTAAPVSAESFGWTDTSNVDFHLSIRDSRRGARFTSPADGTGDSIGFIIDIAGGPVDVECALYLASDGSLVDSTEMISVDHTGPAWVYFSFINSPQLSVSTDYVAMATADLDPTDCTIVRIYAEGEQYWFRNGGQASLWTWPDPIDDITPVDDYTYACLVFYSTETTTPYVGRHGRNLHGSRWP